MNTEQKILRLSALVVGLAILLRLFGSGLTLPDIFNYQNLPSIMVFLGTGRLVSLHQSLADSHTQLPQTNAGQSKKPTQQALFTAEDAALVELYRYCDLPVDIPALLEQPLSWDLTEDGPAVLILHTHSSESYTQTENYQESSPYRTLDEDYNVISIGDKISQVLETGGVQVLHDKTMHDYPSYNGSYAHAREAIRTYLEKYPSIRMVLDIHRDAAEDGSGEQINYTVQTDKGESAKLMLVVGTDAGGLEHPLWQENMALAVKLHAQLQKANPDICRPISFRASRFNQDLSPGALLVEVGAAGNTRQQALVAAEILAEEILGLAKGSA